MTDHQSSIPMALTLHFAAGQRPDATDLCRLAAKPAESTSFSVSHVGKAEEGWLEMLAMGLTYDVSGLLPAGQAPALAAEHLFGLDSSILRGRLETVRVVAGPHAATGRAMLPVIRVLAGLGAEMARLPGLRAIGWEPARSWMAPAYFMSGIRAWLTGGAFPAFGLTALTRQGDAAMSTDGLSLFTGYEATIEALPGENAQETAKLSARVIHHLVRAGPAGLESLTDAGGRMVNCEFGPGKSLLRVWRQP